MPELPFISVIVPCRNEKKYIEGLLKSIDSQDYPKDRLEVIIADGMSNDGTREILSNIKSKYNYLIVIDNEKKIVPTALNKAIKMSKGEYIIRLDAHSVYPKNYFSRLIEVIEETGADNVGAMWDTQPGDCSLKAKAIALAMSHKFGVGNAVYRLPTNKTEPFEVDTVPFGCYRRSVFERIGYFDERMVCNEDNDFNDRLIKSGGKILLIPDLKIKYFARENYTKLWKMFWRYSFYMPYVNKKLKEKTRWTRYVPSVFVLSLICPFLFGLKNKKINIFSLISLFSYFSLSLIVSKKISKNNIKLLFYLFIAFWVSHLSYGTGYLSGWFYFSILNRKPQKILKINR